MKTKGKSPNKKTKEGRTKKDSPILRDENDVCTEIMSLYDTIKQKEYELFELREKKSNREKNRGINR